MKINYARAKTLCTATEFSLLEESKPARLTQFTAAELKRKIAQARKYADKWRDQARSQAGPADRSKEKQELFSEALSRFEGRLERVSSKTASKNAPAGKAAKSTGKKVAKNTVRKAAARVAKKAAKKAAKTGAKEITQGGVKKSARPLSLKKQAKQQAIVSSTRIEASGLTSRIRGHVSARGRRNQAARESRNG